jgi:uncharacterized membrane protein
LALAALTGLAVSHYGTTYLVIGALSGAWILALFAKPHLESSPVWNLLTFPLLAFFAFFSLFWYIYFSGGSVFNSFVQIGDDIFQELFSAGFDTRSSQGFYVIAAATSLPRAVTKYLHLFAQGLITLGLAYAFLSWRRRRRAVAEHLCIAVMFLVILGAGLVVPLFASQLNTSRLYQIALVCLAPFFPLGVMALTQWGTRFRRKRSRSDIESLATQLATIFLSIFFVFNVGAMYALMGDRSSIAMSSDFDYAVFQTSEVGAVRWLSQHSVSTACADSYRFPLLRSYLPSEQVSSLPSLDQIGGGTPFQNCVLFLGRTNVISGLVIVPDYSQNRFGDQGYIPTAPYLAARAQVYDAGPAVMYGGLPS